MALDKIMPDDMNEIACAMLVYIGENDKQAGRDMSYGDFGKLLQKNHGKRAHGGAYDDCTIYGRADKIRITTLSGNEYELTWNKIAKFIHPYLKSTAVSETAETDTPTDTAAFDYSAVDEDTANYLRKATARIANSYADIGAVLAEAQERLANNKNGVFEKWYTFLGMKKSTVHDYIHIHKKRQELLISSEFRTISENSLEVFDSLPKTLQIDISSPSAPAEAVNAVLSGDITTHKDYIAMKKQLEETQEENERLTEKNRFLSMDYTHEKERNERMLDELKEFREKSDALALELKEARSEAREVIMTDPKESQEYKTILDERNKMHRQIVATTQENDRLKDKQKELLQRYNELYEQARAAENDSRELTGYFLPVSVEEYSDICKQLKGTKYAELLYKARLIKF